jgi:hypothetical protein
MSSLDSLLEGEHLILVLQWVAPLSGPCSNFSLENRFEPCAVVTGTYLIIYRVDLATLDCVSGLAEPQDGLLVRSSASSAYSYFLREKI